MRIDSTHHEVTMMDFEYLVTASFQEVEEYLEQTRLDRNDIRFRWFAAACCRHYLHEVTIAPFPDAVAQAEWHGQSVVSDELRRQMRRARRSKEGLEIVAKLNEIYSCVSDDALEAAAYMNAPPQQCPTDKRVVFLRDIFGKPFQKRSDVSA